MGGYQPEVTEEIGRYIVGMDREQLRCLITLQWSWSVYGGVRDVNMYGCPVESKTKCDGEEKGKKYAMQGTHIYSTIASWLPCPFCS